MKDKVIEHINILFSNYEELVETVPEELLGKELKIPKSKTLGEQLWCVIGARESYAKGLEEGQWSGFSCSLAKSDVENKAKVLEHIKSSAQTAKGVIGKVSDWGEDRSVLLLNLLEHETMHEGQIIRLVYGFGETLPESWVDRWA